MLGTHLPMGQGVLLTESGTGSLDVRKHRTGVVNRETGRACTEADLSLTPWSADPWRAVSLNAEYCRAGFYGVGKTYNMI